MYLVIAVINSTAQSPLSRHFHGGSLRTSSGTTHPEFSGRRASAYCRYLPDWLQML